MTDNARIVREALEFYAEPLAWVRSQMVFPRPEPEKDLVCEGPSPADADRGDEARSALIVMDALETELATAKADLERARKEVAEALGTLKYSEKHGSPQHSHCIPGRWDSNGRECADCKAWEKVRSFASIRAALAPEQKGE